MNPNKNWGLLGSREGRQSTPQLPPPPATTCTHTQPAHLGKGEASVCGTLPRRSSTGRRNATEMTHAFGTSSSPG
eukprot:scaffold135788_cov14-Tisochrysis_lutea.AAC.1